MKDKKSFLLLLVAFAVVLVGAAVLYNTFGDAPVPGTVAQPQDAQRVEAPDFTVIDGEGNEVKLSDFRGKPVVLNFWASWCGPCKSEMPAFDEKYRQLGDEVVFMMINATDGGRETVDTAKEFISDSGYSFPVYYDTMYEANYFYGVTALPTTFFIDAEGYAVGYTSGAMSEAFLQQCIDLIYGNA